MKSKITLFLLAFLIFVGNVNSYSNGAKIDPPKVSTLSNGTVQCATVTLIQPTCLLATGTITVTAPLGVGLTYSIDGINYQSSPIFAGLAAGSYNVTVNGGGGCISTITVAVILSAPAVPVAATVTLIQPTCLL
ncbi:hypothetical protein, partial [Flavobacterium sp. GT3P67]|uniref:hypothetical protein n=1 Tax=Flavobacterium sp. GT3P67 TaxID=2541722 RepID=UPI0010457086